MLNKLRVKFVLAATAALLLALALVMIPVYHLASGAIENQIGMITNAIIANDGQMPPSDIPLSGSGLYYVFSNAGDFVTEELKYETRFFTIRYGSDDDVISVNTSSVYSVDDREATQIAEQIKNIGRSSGRCAYGGNIYIYRVARMDDGSKLMVFVDGTSRMAIITAITNYMLLVSAIIMWIFVIILAFLSKRVVQPFIENSEKQKRFITNASHELKTPLAVISANTEMVEVLNGKSQWTESTLRQVGRLNSLVSELVTLTKIDEKDEIVLIAVDASAIVTDQANTFSQVILRQEKQFEVNIAENVQIISEPRAVEELTSILLDNASKYCDEKGCVKLSLTAVGKSRFPQAKKTENPSALSGARLTVSNNYAEGASVDYKKFFDRFYRQDESHNSKKSGFGIGLSIAQELCSRIGAKISVSYKNGEITFTILFR